MTKIIGRSYLLLLFTVLVALTIPSPLAAQVPIIPSSDELNRSFGKADETYFNSPPKVYHPETWFHFIGGNVSKEGITADLEAIAAAGISGIQLFHGQFGGAWPGVSPQITCLSDLWDDAVKHTAQECRRLGLRFSMQNCPGWAMSGGPWIEPSNAMRNITWSRKDVKGGDLMDVSLVKPQPSDEPWRDYRDIAVMAFPTPDGDSDEPLKPEAIKSNQDSLPWMDCLLGKAKRLDLSPTTPDKPYWLEISFHEPVAVRTVELWGIDQFNLNYCYDPGITIKVEAILPDGTLRTLRNTPLPQLNWQDESTLSLACSEIPKTKKFRIYICNEHPMAFRSLRLLSAARKNNWEAAAGFTLRGIIREGELPNQSTSAFIDPDKIRDISSFMDEKGVLRWKVPPGKWTILRIGHVNTGMRNGPAPAEGTGWECNKLSESGPDVHFANYIGRLSSTNGPAGNGLLNGMLMDSWECKTQTWTTDMEAEFKRMSGYELRQWFPALMGYVVGDHEKSTRFLLDWRNTINDLFVNKFYGRMAKLAKDERLSVSFETSAGDIFPADILEYYKYADVPMCEFWQPHNGYYVGSSNYKDIKPTTSAARIYGKPRIAAEAFTSFNLTWDEHWSMLKEVANINAVEGVTHLVFHTYTHNPRTDFLPPGTSFGTGIGTPFLRGQTWWKQMPEFVNYLSRCNYMLERGKPVSDVLWYLGDEINHKPLNNAPFPKGYKYDYCNPDVLLNRLSVHDGMVVTPEGISYRVLWLPDIPRMLPQTLEKVLSLVQQGATIVGNQPIGLATLADSVRSQQRFDKAVTSLWGASDLKRERKVGKGKVLSGMSLDEALTKLGLAPDVKSENGDVLWLHRKITGADWYYVCAPEGSGYQGTVNFRNTGLVEVWDPLTGLCEPIKGIRQDDRTLVPLNLPQAGSYFVVFRHTADDRPAVVSAQRGETLHLTPLENPWVLSFPAGWDAPDSLLLANLKPWKDLDISAAGKAFSGTATYSTSFHMDQLKHRTRITLSLGKVDMLATVYLNGKPLRTLWTAPYELDITDAVKAGTNQLKIAVTSTWFNRLVYDANQPEERRKTWTINGPSKDAPLRETGLFGPVELRTERR